MAESSKPAPVAEKPVQDAVPGNATGANALAAEKPVKLETVAEEAAPALPPLHHRLIAAHRAAERSGDHANAGALNSVMMALGDLRHRASTGLTVDGLSDESRALIVEVMRL